MAELVSLGDVETLIGETLEGAEVGQVTGFIQYAGAIARARVSYLDDRLEAGSLDPDLVRGVLSEVVARALDTVRIGRRTRSVQFPEVLTGYADAAGVVYLTDDEVRQLAGTAESGSAFSISPGYVPG